MARVCAVCGLSQPEEASYCSSCGEPTPGVARRTGTDAGGPDAPPAKKTGTLTIVLIVLGCVFLCGIPGIAIVAAIAIPNLLAAKLSANETAARATLRNLASCQAQVQASGKIDCDGDGIGEYGTFLEMTGSTGIRRGISLSAGGIDHSASDFTQRGSIISPPLLSPALGAVDSSGVVTKSGYCFMIFLPDSSKQRGWVHETGPATSPGLAGGTGRIGVDAAEEHWCAYAWPVAKGNSGNRCFFVDEKGDVYQSSNEVARRQGVTGIPGPESSFAAGKPGPQPGAPGNDGDVWKVTN
jgi:type II secretory pathway pseudopilin PulG